MTSYLEATGLTVFGTVKHRVRTEILLLAMPVPDQRGTNFTIMVFCCVNRPLAQSTSSCFQKHCVSYRFNNYCVVEHYGIPPLHCSHRVVYSTPKDVFGSATILPLPTPYREIRERFTIAIHTRMSLLDGMNAGCQDISAVYCQG